MREGARIEHLRVRAHGRRGVSMVQSAVEDAFRTELSAAGPAVKRGLLVIRHIDLGPMASRADQPAIKRRLAAILREAARDARIPSAGEVVAQRAVLFPDPLSPFIAVMQAIARKTPIPRTWPYRAVMGEALFGPQDQLVETILARQLELAQAGPALRSLLLALGPEVAATLPKLSERLRNAIVGELSTGSHRSVSAAGTAGVFDLVTLADDLGRSVADPAVITGFATGHLHARTPVSAFQVLSALALGSSARPVSTARTLAVARALRAMLAATGQSEALLGAMRQRIERLQQVATASLASSSITASVQEPEDILEITDPAQAESEREETSSDRSNSAPHRMQEPGSPHAELVPESHADLEETPGPLQVTGFDPSYHAGIVYLIVLIQRSFGHWINSPEHLDRASGQRLLHQIMDRLALHPEDPAQCFLRSLGSGQVAVESPCGFSIPADLLQRSMPLMISKVAGHPGWRMVTGGRMLIAVWHGRASARLRQNLRSAARIERCASRHFDEREVLASCELWLRRYLQQGPRLRMHQLVKRGGELAYAPTHLDISFDASVVDLAIRRWALDLSPGWCPWLWRVVTIHYDFGEQDAG